MAAKKKELTYENPGWPDAERFGETPVTDRSALVAGGLSPFGQETFPLAPERINYIHPNTVISGSPLAR